MNFIDETLDILEAAMDRGVAEVGDLIEFTQLFQDFVANRGPGNFAPARLQFMHDIVDRFLECHQADGTFFTGLRHAVRQLASIEGFMGTVPFDHAQIGPFNFFVSGETESTGKTNSPPPNARTISRLSRIDDLVIAISALWTAHGVAGRTNSTTRGSA